MYINSRGTGYVYKGININFHSYLTLGNLGTAQPQCHNVMVNLPEMELSFSCTTGTIQNITYMGVLPNNTKNANGDHILKLDNGENVYKDYCGNNSDINIKCDGMIDKEYLQKGFAKNCTGKKACHFKPAMYVNYRDKPWNFAQMSTNEQSCYNPLSLMYVQFKCLQSKEEAKEKQQIGLVIIQICVVISIFFILNIFYLQKVQNLDQKTWDIRNVTASDYTVTMKIPEELWKKYQEDQDKDLITLPIDKFICKEIEERLNKDDIGYAIKKYKNEKAEIGCISFGYNNCELI